MPSIGAGAVGMQRASVFCSLSSTIDIVDITNQYSMDICNISIYSIFSSLCSSYPKRFEGACPSLILAMSSPYA
jgi:hypothetical protein